MCPISGLGRVGYEGGEGRLSCPLPSPSAPSTIDNCRRGDRLKLSLRGCSFPAIFGTGMEVDWWWIESIWRHELRLPGELGERSAGGALLRSLQSGGGGVPMRGGTSTISHYPISFGARSPDVLGGGEGWRGGGRLCGLL